VNRLREAMDDLRARGARGVAPYITAGDGGLERTRAALFALQSAGATCVELGVPFSDPIADGPVLQAAAQRALAHGTSLTAILDMLRAARAEGLTLPVVLFSYANPFVHSGWEASLERARAAGADGILVPDVPIEEGDALRDAAEAVDLCPIFFAAPTTSAERIERAGEMSSGFLYTIGRFGVTGKTTELADDVLAFLERVRSLTERPIAVGFGIANREQVRAVTQHADLAIVGSALVRHMHDTATNQGEAAAIEAARAYVADLVQGTRV